MIASVFLKSLLLRLVLSIVVLLGQYSCVGAVRCARAIVVSGIPGWAAAANGLYVDGEGYDNTTVKWSSMRYVHGVLDGQFVLEMNECLGGWALRPSNVFISYARHRFDAKPACADAWLIATSSRYDGQEAWCLENETSVWTWGVGKFIGETLDVITVRSGEADDLIRQHGPQYTACWSEGQDSRRDSCCLTPQPGGKREKGDDAAFSCTRDLSDRHGRNSLHDLYGGVAPIDEAIFTGLPPTQPYVCFDDSFLFDECCEQGPAGAALKAPIVLPSSGMESVFSSLQLAWEDISLNASLLLDVPPFAWALGVNQSFGNKFLRFRTFKLQSYDFQLVCDEFFVDDQYHVLRRSSFHNQREFPDSNIFGPQWAKAVGQSFAGIRQGRRRTRRNKMLDGMWASVAARLRVRAILDLGASFGFLSVVASHLFPAAQILAVEANPLTYRYLLWNIRENGAHRRVNALHAAVVLEPLSPSRMNPCWSGTAATTGYCHGVQHGVGAAGVPKIRVDADDEEKMQLVPGVSFDALMDQLGVGAWIDPSEVILKIDCEGCEVAVFSSRAWHRWKDRFLSVVGELHSYARNDGKEGLPSFSSFEELAKDYPPAAVKF